MVGWMGWTEGVSLGDATAGAVVALIIDTIKKNLKNTLKDGSLILKVNNEYVYLHKLRGTSLHRFYHTNIEL